ncbi:TIGR04063 family PEP-CTERM/XrtA system glycosyltransferase [Erythrobacter sp. F6033]|uniref:TIGR04063 family PEP-CTERM/XrtA system glycosyltransferase n=1 Tax=Erythrobacter sp. F6033 TaxID=2926401 RepID=UPI001FF512D2|nr:TIGR04063 family PEP-CTERM/XrtA system glycosyltransferase [Erythrobacter sp. F6033]MCK0129592.1 glycosyltransferase, exosortase A system-associated [Erythrobacter sp. F6033]
MTRILHVLDHSLPLHSGYTFRTRAILKAQQAAGLEVRGITAQRHQLEAPTGEDVEIVDGLTFHRTAGVPNGPMLVSEFREMAALSASIQKVAKDWRPDIIHAHSPALNGGGAHRAASALGIPLVYEIRAFWEDAAVGNRTGTEGSAKYRLTRSLETQIVKRADAVFTICQGLRDDLINRGIAPGKIGVMPNGVDLSMFGEPLPRDNTLASELGIAEGAPVIGYIGSFYDYEGVDDLIKAMPILRRDHPDAKLLLVGAGDMDAEWRAAAAALGEPDSVIFTGRVPHSEVERYYSLIDVLAYPRKQSRLTDLVTPLKPLEAMAQRRIVAASNVGGHRELISHGETGFLFTPDDPKACAAALSEMLASRDEWDAIRNRGEAHVRARHDWATNVQRYLSVYQVLLANGEHESGPAPAEQQTQLRT